ncbi:MAG: hypothetical protein U9N77_05175 [Thermodesulfobacteriota bacterium]|nr:hypothetical protein [Thermodesulfobacteriota bacterium]
MMITIPGYEIIAKIYESNSTLVYSGIKSSDRLPVILKTTKNKTPLPADLARLKHE